MSTPPRPDEPRDAAVPHDAWLQAALRHAPDAQAAPPDAVRDAILRAAHAQAAGPSAAGASRAGSPSVLQRLLAAWSWLARPPVAAGFASVMVATIAGVLWWDRPLEEALPPREAARVAQAPVAAERGEAPVPTAPTPVPQTAPQPAAVPPAAPRPAPATAAREAEARRRAAAARDAAQSERRAELAAKVEQTEQRKAAAADRAIASTAPTTAPAVAAAPAITPPPSAAPSAMAAPEPGGAGQDAAAAAAQVERRSAAAGAAAPAPSAQAFARREATPLGALRTGIATEPERWSWQRDGGAVAPMSTAVMQWLQRVGETGRARWAPQTERAEAAAAVRTTTLVLLRDGRVHTTLQLGAEAIEVTGATGPRQRADLRMAEATALRVELDQATR